ncbi:hypothetical protein ILYODFUR_036344 [Ilyodon furcidens]|uniref:C-type lectin domain-containing protein n=1 Tax=Ilyodon furcidens TaxID=33524 RepID=A0ABV0T3A3_9TELE
MKPVLLLSVLLCAAFAAPVEEEQKPAETAQEVQTAETADVQGPAVRFNFCSEGWFMYESRCFRFFNTPLSWYDAEEQCNSLGGHLASVSNPRQYSFLQQMTQTAGQTIAWLGGFNLQGRWLWIDREGFYYTNWSSQLTASGNPCIFLNSATGWSNRPCTSNQRFICSKNAFGC